MSKFIFLQKCHPAASLSGGTLLPGGKLDGPWANKLTAGSSGGSYLPPDELAEGATAELQPAIDVL